MKVLITGATGLVGTALTKALVTDGHTVCRLMRRETVSAKTGPARQGSSQVLDVPWDPESSDGLSFADSQGEIAGAEAVVNLAGAPIASERWTTQRKMVLRSSRARTTRSLVAALGKLKTLPKAFVSASAIGYYGNRGEEALTEDSKAGADFLAQVALEMAPLTARTLPSPRHTMMPPECGVWARAGLQSLTFGATWNLPLL